MAISTTWSQTHSQTHATTSEGKAPFGETAASPLLDAYPGAAAAYSLRALTGNPDVILARRGGDDAELAFSASEVADGTLTSWSSDGGGDSNAFVKTWYDQSGNGLDASNTTAANQPAIVVSGVLQTEGGLPAMVFDGTNDRLTSTHANRSQPYSVFIVARDTGTGLRRLVSGDNDQGQVYVFNSEITYYAGTVRTNPAVLVNQQSYVTAIFDDSGGNSVLRVSGAVASALSPGAGAQGDLKIGVRGSSNVQFWLGTVQEVVVYLSDQTSNVSGIEGNIATHYSI